MYYTREYLNRAHREIDTIFRVLFPEHGMAVREEQIMLCHKMLDNLLGRNIALCDAGVGIGKTYAIKSKYASITGCMVYFNDSQQIKIVLNQLRALGLIYSSWSENAGKLYWGLTIKGRRYRDEMIVVKENMMSVDNTEE